jgi:hypothetical protein
MARPPKESLRPLTEQERAQMEQTARSHSERADVVSGARALLAVADGSDMTHACQQTGRRNRQALARLVVRFNREGMAAVWGHHGGGATVQYGPKERERILQEVRRIPDRERDGTATWSLKTRQRALRRAPDGLPKVSTWVLFHTLHDANFTFQASRTWCETGTVKRKRKTGTVQVRDPHAAEKGG